jgi:hypothetical protein
LWSAACPTSLTISYWCPEAANSVPVVYDGRWKCQQPDSYEFSCGDRAWTVVVWDDSRITHFCVRADRTGELYARTEQVARALTFSDASVERILRSFPRVTGSAEREGLFVTLAPLISQGYEACWQHSLAPNF